jgi:hypothetical protein
MLGRVVTGMVRPFVPAPVGRLVADPAIAVRTARTLLEEVEEVRFVFQRKRTITTSAEDTEITTADQTELSRAARPDEPLGPVRGTVRRVTRRGALADGETPAELSPESSPAKLSPAESSLPELPPAEDDR